MVDPKTAIIVIPTFNEVENIERLTQEIFRYEPRLNLLFVDDASPDGTAALIKKIQQKYPNVYLLERSAKLGLGTAYLAGFKFALDRGYEYIFEMDADFSHDPKEIPNFLKAIEENDCVIGSRYIKGVNVVNWPLSRLLLSYFANLYTRIVTGIQVFDSTGGYKCFRRQVLENLDFNKIKSNGYAFQIELNFRVWKKGYRVKEIPIIFIDRIYGESKLSKKIMWEAMLMVWKLRILGILGRI